MSLLTVTLGGVVILGFDQDPKPQSVGLVGKPAPALDLPLLNPRVEGQKRLTAADLKGRKVVLHFFASWCRYCRDEHPVIKALGARSQVLLYGVNIHDKREEALAWLAKEGNPYDLIGFDEKGGTAKAWRVLATPQTFVIDEHGLILYQHSGMLTPQRIQEEVLPLL